MLAPPPGPPIQSASRSPIGWRRPRDQIGELLLADTDHAVKLEASDWLALSLVHLQYHVRTGMSGELPNCLRSLTILASTCILQNSS